MYNKIIQMLLVAVFFMPLTSANSEYTFIEGEYQFEEYPIKYSLAFPSGAYVGDNVAVTAYVNSANPGAEYTGAAMVTSTNCGPQVVSSDNVFETDGVVTGRIKSFTFAYNGAPDCAIYLSFTYRNNDVLNPNAESYSSYYSIQSVAKAEQIPINYYIFAASALLLLGLGYWKRDIFIYAISVLAGISLVANMPPELEMPLMGMVALFVFYPAAMMVFTALDSGNRYKQGGY